MKKNCKFLFLFALFGLFNLHVAFSQHDSTYYKPGYNHGFNIRPYLFYNVYGMQIENTHDTTSYATNNPMGIGIGISHPKLPFDISAGYSIKATLNRKQLRTKSFDMQVHTYGRKYVFDVVFNKYKGFYIEDFDLTTKNENCNDLSVLSIGTVGQYVFNNKRFSYRAAYNQKEVQLKSAGTFLVGVGLYFFQVKSPNFSIYEDKKYIKNFQFGLNGGYSYSWVIKKWLLNCSLSGGANIGTGNIDTPAEKKLFLKPTALARISVFRNTPRWSIGVMGVYNLGVPIYTKEIIMKLHSGQFNLVYLYRFNKIRKKSSKRQK